MALLNKTGITDNSIIQSEHVTRTIDALTGVSTDTIIATGSFNGPLTGTASFATSASRAVSSSFATTASYATNAGGGSDTFTIQMMHLKQGGTTDGSVSYFGPFASDTFPSSGRIGYSMPAATTIVSASVFVHSAVVDITAQNIYSLIWNDGGSTQSSSIANIKLLDYLKYDSATLNQPVSASSVVAIKMNELVTSTASFVSTVLLTLKKS
jgi:hypothetical protein